MTSQQRIDAAPEFASLFEEGRAARAAGNRLAALDLFRQALALRPGEVWAGTALADTLRELGRAAEAEAGYRALLAAHPDHLGALMGLGHTLRGRRDLEGALPLFERALALRPGEAWARMAVADTLRDLGRTAEAEAGYRAMLAEQPEHLPALMGLGYLAGSQADPAASAAWFERAVQAGGNSPSAWLALAAARRDAGDFAGATAAARAVLARDPQAAEAWMSIGQSERRAGRRAAARDAFQEAVRLAPDLPRALIELAVEERQLGRLAASEALLHRVLAADPQHAEALQQFGEQHRLAGRLDTALEFFDRATAAPQPTPWGFLAAADILARLGRPDAALERLAQAREALGPLPEFAAKEAELLRRAGEWPQALELVAEASRAAPRHFGLWFERAQLEHIRGGRAACAALLREVPARTTHDQARALQLEGIQAAEEWQFEEAIALYARAIALNPEDAWLRITMAQAQLLSLDVEAARLHLRAAAGIDAAQARLQGRSANVSQTHLGQLLDEFLLDREALAALRALRPLPPEGRIPPLLALLRRHPDYTPAAVILLISLRQAGRFTPGPDSGTPATPGAIPRRLAQYWDSPELPPDLGRVMQSWAALYPDVSLRRFSDAEAQEFLAASHPAGVLNAYRRCRQPAQKADIFRLAWLEAGGGYYVDSDDLLVGRLEDLAPGAAGLVCYQEDFGTLGNNFIGAVPGHPVMARALELAVEAVNRDDNDLLWLSTGPGLLTRAFAGHLAELGPERIGAPDGVRVLALGELRRVVSIHCLVGYKSTARHWSQTAFGRRAALGSGQARRAA